MGQAYLSADLLYNWPDRMKKSNILLAGLITMALLISLFYYFDLFKSFAILVGISVTIVIILFTIGISLIFVLAIPYYFLTKKKKVQEHGSYSLDDIEGEE